MNTKEINPGSNGTLPLFVTFAALLTIATIWIFIALRNRYLLPGKTFVQRLAWPVLLLYRWWYRKGEYKARGRLIDRTMRDDYEEEMQPNDSWV